MRCSPHPRGAHDPPTRAGNTRCYTPHSRRTRRFFMRSVYQSTTSTVKRPVARACSTVETLEQRVFLSGSVLAEGVHGNLQITGDASANVIVINQKGLKAHQFRVFGDSSTTINGKLGSAVVSGVM